jgi:Fur family ferric uptake transcriptional regulator
MKSKKLSQTLSCSGLKNTKHRLGVLDILLGENRAFTAYVIFLRLVDHDHQLSLSTIYRILNRFASQGLIIKTQPFHEKKATYEAHHKEHQHFLFCLRCSESIEIETCPIKTLEQTLTQKTNYQIVGHKMDIYGYCPQCQKDMTSLPSSAKVGG